MQNRQPMQRWKSISTMPSLREKVAWVGQTFTQGGSAQCRHSASTGLSAAFSA